MMTIYFMNNLSLKKI